MIKKLLFLGALFITVLGLQNAKAQNSYSIVSVSEQGMYYVNNTQYSIANNTLTFCSQYVLTYTITTNTSPANDNITINLPYGITYMSQTGTPVGGTVTYSSGTNSPQFTTSWSGNSLTFSIIVQTPSCTWSPANPPNTFTTVSGTDMLNGSPFPASTYFTPGAPNLNVNAWVYTSFNGWVPGASTVNVNPGETGEIAFAFTNTGTGGITDINLSSLLLTLNTNITLTGYCVTTGISGPPTSTCGSYGPVPGTGVLLSSANGDFSGYPSDQFTSTDNIIYVHFAFQVKNNCVNGIATFNFNLGCGALTNCSPTYTFQTDFNIEPGAPSITAPPITALQGLTNSDGCESSQSANMGFVFKNNGSDVGGNSAPPPTSGRATKVQAIFNVEDAMGSINSGTFMINGQAVPIGWVSGPLSDIGGFSSYIIDFTQNHGAGAITNLGPNSLTDLDGDGIYDELAPGATFTLTVSYNYKDFNAHCPANFNICEYRQEAPIFADAKYNNELCTLTGEPTMALDNTEPTQGNIGAFGYNHISSTNATITDPTGPNVTQTPANNEPGPIVEMNVCPGNYNQSWGPDGASNDFQFACPKADWQAVISVPINYILNIADASYPLQALPNNQWPAYAVANGVCACYTFTYPNPPITAYPGTNPSNTVPVSPIIEDYTNCNIADCSGPHNVVVDFGNQLKDPNAPFVSTYNLNCFTVPFKLACNCLNQNPHSWDNFQLNMNYLCDPNTPCSTCYDALACANTQLSHHCDGMCSNNGLNIFGSNFPLSFNRTTLGWVYQPTDYDQCTYSPTPPLTQLVAPDPTKIHLDRAYPGDEIEEKMTGCYDKANTTMSSVYLETTWQVIAGLGGPQTFLNIETTKSTFTLTDGANQITCQGTCTPVVNGGTVVYDVVFDINGLNFINNNQADSIVISADIFWVVSTTPIGACFPSTTIFCPGAYPMQQLQAGFGGTAGNNVYTSCDLWDANFEILQPGVQETSSESSTTYCQESTQKLSFSVSGGLANQLQDDFPNEFRPYAMPTNPVKITVPQYYTYQPGSAVLTAYIDQYQLNPLTNNIVPLTLITYSTSITPTSISPGPNNSTVYQFDPCWPMLDCKYAANANGIAPQIVLSYSVTPLCNAPDSAFIEEGSFQTSTQQYDPNIRPNATYGVVTEGMGRPRPTTDTVQFRVQQVNPLVTVACPAVSPSVYTNTTTFTVTISNNSGHTATDAWLAIEQTGSFWTFVSATPSNYTNVFGNNLFIDYGSLPTGHNVNIVITATANPSLSDCDNANGSPIVTSLTVISGNQCTGQAIHSPLDPAACQESQCNFNASWYPSTISLNETSAPTSMVLCNKLYTFSFTIDNNDAGTTINPAFWMNLPAGLTLVDANFIYGACNVHNVASNATYLGNPEWDLANIPSINSCLQNALLGGTTITVNITVQTSCNYAGGPIQFGAFGTTSCGGTPLNTPTITNTPTIFTCPSVTISQTNAGCNGNNGSATVTVTGGLSPYSFTWSNNNLNSATQTGLSAGTYNVTVTDQNGCTATASFTITGSNSNVAVAITSLTNVSCNGACDGQATANASGGTGPYNYAWTPSGGNNATATGLCAGTYVVTATDVNGCTGSISITITQPPPLTLTISSTPNCGNIPPILGGSATVVASGGTPGYIYAWSNGGSTSTISGLTSGTYNVTVTDAHGCTATASVVVYSLTQPSISGQATACPPPGTYTFNNLTPGATYSWTATNATPASGSNTSPVTISFGPAGGVITLTECVPDPNSPQKTLCCVTTTFKVAPCCTFDGATFTNVVNEKCYGDQIGKATVNPIGGTPAYVYAWSPGGQTTQTATGLSAGTYNVTITDANGCTETATVTITQPTPIVLTMSSTPSCGYPPAVTGGTATVIATGGTQPYGYSWFPTGGTNATASNLGPGTYVVTVTDANGCTATASVVVNLLTQPTISGAPTACNGPNVYTFNNLTPGAVYSWTATNATPSSGSNVNPVSINFGPAGGVITLTECILDPTSPQVKDLCCVTTTFTVTKCCTLISDYSGTITNEPCFGDSSGGATIIPIGGTAPYVYSWSPSGKTTQTVSGLTAGTYTVTITDANGCTVTVTVTITQPPKLNATVSLVSNVTCKNGFDGKASITASGGTPGYQYSWSPSGGTNATATGLTAGTYVVTVTDANGCKTQVTVTITQPNNNLNITYGCSGRGIIGVNPIGGTPPYTFIWSPLPPQILVHTPVFEMVKVLCTTYTLTVYDKNHNCDVIVINPADVDNFDCCKKIKHEASSDSADVPEDSLVNITLYPDPNTGRFNISGLELGENLELYNLFGQLIKSYKVTASTMEFNIEEQPNSMYIMLVISKDGVVVKRLKLMKTQ